MVKVERLAMRHESYTVKNGVFQNSCVGCVCMSTPLLLLIGCKPPFEGVTGHPQNTLN